jgi:hypothetical protein
MCIFLHIFTIFVAQVLFLGPILCLDTLTSVKFWQCLLPFTSEILDNGIGGWKGRYNEELHNLYSSPNAIRIMKSRRASLARHVTRIGAKRDAYRVWVAKPRLKGQLGGSKRERIILKWNMRQ